MTPRPQLFMYWRYKIHLPILTAMGDLLRLGGRVKTPQYVSTLSLVPLSFATAFCNSVLQQ